MTRILTIILLAVFSMACEKLNSEQVTLKYSCPECKEEIETQLLSIQGLKYADFDTENKILIIHYEKDETKIEAEMLLLSRGFIQDTDSSVNIIPSCCAKLDSLQ
jgi:copper chaperone CopZ